MVILQFGSKPRLIAVFTGVVATDVIITGYLFSVIL